MNNSFVTANDRNLYQRGANQNLRGLNTQFGEHFGINNKIVDDDKDTYKKYDVIPGGQLKSTYINKPHKLVVSFDNTHVADPIILNEAFRDVVSVKLLNGIFIEVAPNENITPPFFITLSINELNNIYSTIREFNDNIIDGTLKAKIDKGIKDEDPCDDDEFNTITHNGNGTVQSNEVEHTQASATPTKFITVNGSSTSKIIPGTLKVGNTYRVTIKDINSTNNNITTIAKITKFYSGGSTVPTDGTGPLAFGESFTSVTLHGITNAVDHLLIEFDKVVTNNTRLSDNDELEIIKINEPNSLLNSFATLDYDKTVDRDKTDDNSGTDSEKVNIFKNNFGTHHDIRYFDPPLNSLSQLNITSFKDKTVTTRITSNGAYNCKLEFMVETKEKLRVY